MEKVGIGIAGMGKVGIGIGGMGKVGLFSKLVLASLGLESLSSLKIILFISALVKSGAPPDSPIHGKFVGLIILKSTKYSNRK